MNGKNFLVNISRVQDKTWGTSFKDIKYENTSSFRYYMVRGQERMKVCKRYRVFDEIRPSRNNCNWGGKNSNCYIR